MYKEIRNQYIKLSFTENKNLTKIYINNKEYNTKYNNQFIIESVDFNSGEIYYINDCNNKISIENLILKVTDTTPPYKIS